MYKKKIMVLVGSYKTIPPVGADYPGIVDLIYKPIELLSGIQVVSLWDSKLSGVEYNKRKYLHAKINRLSFVGKIPYRIRKNLFGHGDIRRAAYYLDMMILLRKIKPDVVITHIDPRLAILATRVYPKAEHVFYYHGSILADTFDEDGWKDFSSRIQKLVVICRNAVKGLEDKFGEITINNRVVLNAINIDCGSSESRLANRMKGRNFFGIGDKNVLVVYAGRIVKTKGLYEMIAGFIEAYKENKDLRLIIAGDPAKETYGDFQYFKVLKEISSNVPDNVIRFVGWLSRDQLNLLYAAGNIAVLTSTREGGEANSLFLMESMGHGLACIATDVGGNPEVLDGAGILISPDYISKAVADALGELSSKEYREKLGYLAAERARKYFIYERVADELLDFINHDLQ